ncbi:hypothetical protein SPV3_ORF28 [Sulfolobus polyhedral virus 3]|nr:hypothetical protein SPV3_ORF28 [Sulfolobus polyhedral virus 3]
MFINTDITISNISLIISIFLLGMHIDRRITRVEEKLKFLEREIREIKRR